MTAEEIKAQIQAKRGELAVLYLSASYDQRLVDAKRAEIVELEEQLADLE